jgi:hypothetical protein
MFFRRHSIPNLAGLRYRKEKSPKKRTEENEPKERRGRRRKKKTD